MAPAPTIPLRDAWLAPHFDPSAVGLETQLHAVLSVLRDGQWHTPRQLRDATGYQNLESLGARCRDLRKAEYGGHVVEFDHGAYRLVITPASWEA